MTKWLEYETPTSVIGGGKDNDLLALATEPDEAPEQPEVLSILRETRRFSVQYVDGPLISWPYIFRLEMNACLDAETDFKAVLETNLRLKLEAAANKQQVDQ